jgi:hypothetical protein
MQTIYSEYMVMMGQGRDMSYFWFSVSVHTTVFAFEGIMDALRIVLQCSSLLGAQSYAKFII